MTKPRSRWNGAPAAAAMADDAAPKVWAGRLGDETSPAVEEYTAGIDVDLRLLPGDIAGSVAHAAMLRAIGVLTSAEHHAIVSGLERISDEIKRGTFAFQPNDEDIHTAVERRLIELAGPAGGKLHTGRSRNDQVATDLRLYAKGACRDLTLAIADLQSALLVRAEEHISAVMPGYTHLQRAQPVYLGHHLLAYFWMLARDRSRFAFAEREAGRLPLGAGALAGVNFDTDRMSLARELGFSYVVPNSIDAVSGRDFVLDYLAAAATCSTHLSRLGAELVLWSSSEFGFCELPDAWTSGSSIMPQKKNPDAAELLRAKAPRVVAHLAAFHGVMHALPLTYNKDLQEDKEHLFDAVDTLELTLAAATGMVARVRFQRERMAEAASDELIAATDVADLLVRLGTPFREAHGIVAGLVRTALDSGRSLSQLTADELAAHSETLAAHADEFHRVLSQDSWLDSKVSEGGTSLTRVEQQLALARTVLDDGT
jgi:argininosuccinate lyase